MSDKISQSVALGWHDDKRMQDDSLGAARCTGRSFEQGIKHLSAAEASTLRRICACRLKIRGERVAARAGARTLAAPEKPAAHQARGVGELAMAADGYASGARCGCR